MDNFAFEGGQLAAAEWSNHRLLYATPELQKDVHLSGVATVRVRVAADADAANLSVWLVSLPWTESDNINDNIITKGWADPTNAGADNIASPRSGAGLTPGEFVELEFAMQPDDQVIPAGARIGLMVFSSDKYFTVRKVQVRSVPSPALAQLGLPPVPRRGRARPRHVLPLRLAQQPVPLSRLQPQPIQI